MQEYVETLPDGSGKRAINDAGHAVKAPLPESGVVSAPTREKLAGLGDAGSETAALAEATAPRPAAHGASQDTSEGDTGPVLSGVVRTAAGDQGGMGIVLPLLMLVALVGAAGYALSRRQAKG